MIQGSTAWPILHFMPITTSPHFLSLESSSTTTVSSMNRFFGSLVGLGSTECHASTLTRNADSSHASKIELPPRAFPSAWRDFEEVLVTKDVVYVWMWHNGSNKDCYRVIVKDAEFHLLMAHRSNWSHWHASSSGSGCGMSLMGFQTDISTSTTLSTCTSRLGIWPITAYSEYMHLLLFVLFSL